ncbi:MAG: nitroreductase family protein [candidate division WOR-3 bacterium]|nr:nitroreductase family protein [candidate division WOR-3 bacterium]MCX7757387.1 nitroreductase family protein [candidate division WOR-3 bacterium]
MTVKEAISNRRAYRSLNPVPITQELIFELASAVQLAPSCFNNQPWRLVFVYDPEVLDKLKKTLSRGNEWAYDASMIIAVFSKKELDCVINEREYYLFGCGMAAGFLILRATELGLVAHPIAGYNHKLVKEVLGIPGDFTVITLIIIGKHASEIKPVLTEKQREQELNRPERLPFEKFVYLNRVY